MSISNLKYLNDFIDKLLNNKTPIMVNTDIPERKMIVPNYPVYGDYPYENYKFYPDWDKGVLSNGVKMWAVTICVDIRKSAAYYRNDERIRERIIDTYYEELKDIFGSHHNFLYWDKCGGQHHNAKGDIFNGESIYGTYIAPTKEDARTIYDLAVEIYTFNYWFQKILKRKGLPTFSIGIGIGMGQDVFCHFVGFDCHSGLVFLGKGAFDAFSLSKYGNNSRLRNLKTIVINKEFYDCLYDSSKKLFTKTTDYTGAEIYHGDVIYTKFQKWIDEDGLY